LAIDQSTSGTKALLFTTAGELLDQEAQPHTQHYPRPGWVEHDAEEIYHNALQVAGTLLARQPGALHDLIGLSLTNQRETVVVFERGSGRPLHNAIVWQCRRGEPVCQALIKAGHGPMVQRQTGLPLDTYFSAPKLTWLFDNHPPLLKRVLAGEALIGTIDTYLIYRLTGGRVFATDHTNACRTLLYDLAQLGWSDSLCRLFGVPAYALAPIRESGANFGESDLGGQLPRLIPIWGVMGDSQAALLAQSGNAPGTAKVTFGTGSSILVNIGRELKTASSGISTTLAWVHGGQPTYAFEGILNYTGATLAWLRDQLQLIDDVAETESLARSVDDNGGVYLVPAFVGLSAPHWQPLARAAVVGLTPHSRREHVVRAALEAVAYQVRDVLALMAHDGGLSLKSVQGDGGATRNGFLMQFVADLTRLKVQVPLQPEHSALGAAMAGMLGQGVYRGLDDLAAIAGAHRCYSPEMDPERAEQFYTGWQTALRQVLAGLPERTQPGPIGTEAP